MNSDWKTPSDIKRLMPMQVSLKTAESFLTSKAIHIDWLQNLTTRNNVSLSILSGHILRMKGLINLTKSIIETSSAANYPGHSGTFLINGYIWRVE